MITASKRGFRNNPGTPETGSSPVTLPASYGQKQYFEVVKLFRTVGACSITSHSPLERRGSSFPHNCLRPAAYILLPSSRINFAFSMKKLLPSAGSVCSNTISHQVLLQYISQSAEIFRPCFVYVYFKV